MHYLGHRKRLKERLLSSKRGSMASYELLELLLFFAKPRSDVKPLAKELLNKFGNISKILGANSDDLIAVQGVGQSIICLLRCVQEILERTLQDKVKELPVINNWKTLIEYLKGSIGNSSTEKVRVLYLNKKFKVLTDELQDVGTVNQTPLYVREIVKRALAVGATSLILSHNHPSNDPKPSKADIDITNQIMIACQSIDIQLIDHVIITSNNYFSFKTEGLL
ncbi:MAG: DNA repair protein RadC [Rickettsiaceae bacterium H1]|nr:DNA repair protein RadC [Rickettsiaceae bacterium H1]